MNSDQRAAIIDKIVDLVLEKHVDPSDVDRDYAPWKSQVAAQRGQLINRADEEFETGIQQLLAALGTSHMGFTRASNPGMAAIFSLNASLGLVGSDGERQWTSASASSAALFTAAITKSCKIILSSAFSNAESISNATRLFFPFMITFTIPPPDSPLTRNFTTLF